MNGLVTVLGWLLLTLTCISSYRLAAFLAADPTASESSSRAYPALIAVTITVAFTVIADAVIFLTGLAVFAVPIYLLFRDEAVSVPRPGIASIRARLTALRDRATVPDRIRKYSRPNDLPDVRRDEK